MIKPMKRKRTISPDEQKYPQGVKSTYKPEYDLIAYRMALLGAIDTDLAKVFEVCDATIDNWKLQFPSFVGALKDGKMEADSKVAQSLYKRAVGYQYEEKSYKTLSIPIKDDEGKTVDWEYIEVPDKRVVKQTVPDTTACIIWLKNRRSDIWRDAWKIEGKIDHRHAHLHKHQLSLDNLSDKELNMLQTIIGPLLECQPQLEQAK